MAISPLESAMYADQFGDPELHAIMDDKRLISAMIETEIALALAEEDIGLLPAGVGQTIAKSLSSIEIAPTDLASGSAEAGVPVPALLGLLRAKLPADAAHWRHWGATSHDIMDTALVLQLRQVLPTLETRLRSLIEQLERLSQDHENTLMAGRTRGQISTPISFGYKAAQWAQPLIAAHNAMDDLRRSLLRLQFGGATGINAAVAPLGKDIAEALAVRLELEIVPSWHVERSGLHAFAYWLVATTHGLAKIAGDILILSRSEIGEVRSGHGGGSSTMPNKANPVGAESILTLASWCRTLNGGLQASGAHAEDRDGWRWMTEWFVVPSLVVAAGSAMNQTAAQLGSLSIDKARMRYNLEQSGALVEAASFALASVLPRAEAQTKIKEAISQAKTEGCSLQTVLTAQDVGGIDWQNVLDPRQALLPAKSMTKSVFSQWKR